jgi:hypothetical protein
MAAQVRPCERSRRILVERDSVAQSRAATATARGSSSHQKAVVIIGWKAVVIARGQRPRLVTEPV